MSRHIDNADNTSIADALDRVAGRLEAEDEPVSHASSVPFRARAWRRAAEEVRRLDEPVARIARERGLPGLDALPDVGPGIGAAILDLVETGRLAVLDEPGPERAEAEEAEAAEEPALPAVHTLLDVDVEYRRRAAAGTLKRIAPARYNPDHEKWLPVLHTERGPWRFTAVYSNTQKAHELAKTHDWVVIFFERDGIERQCTVVTATHGSDKGRRVVRGREAKGPHERP